MQIWTSAPNPMPPGLVEAIEAAGVTITRAPDNWLTSDPAQASSIASGYDPASYLATARAAQIKLINAAAQAELDAIAAPYPPLEVSTWDQQLAEAQAWTANNAAAIPLVSAIAQASGRTVADLVNSILTLNAQYKASVGAVVGKRVSLTGQINAATTVSQVQSITWGA